MYVCMYVHIDARDKSKHADDSRPALALSPLRMIAARCPLAPSDARTGGCPLYFLHCLILANMGAFRSMFGTTQKTIWFPRIYSCCRVLVLPRMLVFTQSCSFREGGRGSSAQDRGLVRASVAVW